MKKLFCTLIFVVCIYSIINFAFMKIVIAENQTIEILLDGIDPKPLSIKIGEFTDTINLGNLMVDFLKTYENA